MLQKSVYPLTGDLIRLSDMFRRAVSFSDQESAKNLVGLTHKLGCNMTWIYGEYPENHGLNVKARNSIKETLREIQSVAQGAGLDEIILPLKRGDSHAGMLAKILKEGGFGLKFSFRKADYRDDLDALGWIRPEIKTILDEGLRGLTAVRNNIKWKWDDDIQKGGQIALKF